MITAIIIDDERQNVTILSSLLQRYCPQVIISGSATRAADGKTLIEKLKPQLIFLDIEMPYGSGFDLLQSLPSIEAEIIFITSFDQYALNAFRYSALDYLLKPVNIEELENAVQKAEKRIYDKKNSQNYELLRRNIEEKDISKRTVLFTENGHEYPVQLADIKYIRANGNYTHVHTSNKIIVSSKTLKDFEEMFPATVFCRVHNGHIINKVHIAKIQKGRGGNVVMKDGAILEIAVRRKEAFLKMIRSK